MTAERDPLIQEDFEAVAAVQHDIWSHWMRYLFRVCVALPDGSVNIPAEKVERWKRQAATGYADLTEQERESDREQADKVLKVIWRGAGGSDVMLETEDQRRCRWVAITLDYLLAMMTQGATTTAVLPQVITVECTEGLPPGAQVLAHYCSVDTGQRTVRLLIRHPSFESTPRGCNFPEWTLAYQRRWRQEGEEATT